MPNTKSAEKQVRVNQRRRVRNKNTRSEVKTEVTRAEGFMLSGKAEAREAVLTAVKSLDKAAEKRVIHPNNAARRKSRLMKKLNKASAAPKAETKPEQPG